MNVAKKEKNNKKKCINSLSSYGNFKLVKIAMNHIFLR